jgi:hypothetical protein
VLAFKLPKSLCADCSTKLATGLRSPSANIAAQSTPALVSTPVESLRWRLSRSTPDERRVLIALLRRPPEPVRRRHFQRALHRLRATRFNQALTGLVAAGLVICQDGCLIVPAEVRTAARDLGIGVRRPAPRRAWRRPQRQRLSRHEQVRRYLQRHKGSSDWGKWMLAKRGGYARQAQCRALGIHPTAKATAARLAKRSRAKTGLPTPQLATPSITSGGLSAGAYRIRTASDVSYRVRGRS